MVSIPKVVSVFSCGVVLCLGLSNTAQANNGALSTEDEMKSDQSDRRQGGQGAGEQHMSDGMKGAPSQAGKTVTGEVLRVEGGNYFVKGQDGKEVRSHTDQTTEMMGHIQQGDRIEAKVNEQNHVLSIRSARGTDADHGK
jgi:hypothetical protein